MKNFVPVFVFFVFVIVACTSTTPEPDYPALVGEDIASSIASLSTLTPIPPTPTIAATVVVPQPTETHQVAADGINYVGYWLKVVKTPEIGGSWRMFMYWQDGGTLVEVASFCVHGAENNTQDGFFFLAAMRDTMFSRAPAGYNSVIYKHNAVFSVYAPDRNKYLHIGDWNDKGEYECPIKSTGGCINMRKDDFIVLHSGGLYIDPRTGKESQIPPIEVGMPLVVVNDSGVCSTVGDCYRVFGCTGVEQCFKQYTCKLCYNDKGVWYYQTYFAEMIRETKIDLSVFNLPK